MEKLKKQITFEVYDEKMDNELRNARNRSERYICKKDGSKKDWYCNYVDKLSYKELGNKFKFFVGGRSNRFSLKEKDICYCAEDKFTAICETNEECRGLVGEGLSDDLLKACGKESDKYGMCKSLQLKDELLVFDLENNRVFENKSSIYKDIMDKEDVSCSKDFAEYVFLKGFDAIKYKSLRADTIDMRVCGNHCMVIFNSNKAVF